MDPKWIPEWVKNDHKIGPKRSPEMKQNQKCVKTDAKVDDIGHLHGLARNASKSTSK